LSEFVLSSLVPVVGTHPFPLGELMLMAAAVCALEPAEIFEWGTHLGKSARVFAETAEGFGLPTRIVSVDLPDDVAHVEHPGMQRGAFVRGVERVALLQGDGLELSLRAWADGGRKPAPLFFLDGDHSYESVSRELHALASAVPDASMLVHDTFFQSEESGYNVGPHKAVQDLLATYPGRYRALAVDTGLPGMTLLYPSRDAHG
jgi:cephalosporin hydroxylase